MIRHAKTNRLAVRNPFEYSPLMPLPSASQLRQALKLAEKLELMEAELASILGESSDAPKTRRGPGRPPKKAKRQMSEEGRQRIAEAQKKRWAARKKAAGKK